MPNSVRVPLPRSVLASYLVLATAAGDDSELVISRSAERLPPAAREQLASAIGDLRVHDLAPLRAAPIPPTELLRAYGASAPECDQVAAASAGWALLLRHSPHTAESGESAVRTAAVLLAHELEGVVVDPAIPRLVPVDLSATGSALSTDWHSFDHVDRREATDVSTRGLERFGLPELVARDISAAAVPAWDAILSGVAHLVMRRLRGAEESRSDPGLDLPAELSLTVRDIAAAYGQPVDTFDPTVLRATELQLSYVEGPSDRLISITACSDAVADLFGEAV